LPLQGQRMSLGCGFDVCLGRRSEVRVQYQINKLSVINVPSSLTCA